MWVDSAQINILATQLVTQILNGGTVSKTPTHGVMTEPTQIKRRYTANDLCILSAYINVYVYICVCLIKQKLKRIRFFFE